MIIKDGAKMSKSKGNVVSPDELVEEYGRDSLRMYELFVGPPELDAEWDDRGIDGVYRFINRFYNLIMNNKDKLVDETDEMVKIRNRMTYDISNRLESFSFNTVISGFMEYNNKLIDISKENGGLDKETMETAVILLAPFAPHVSEELWQALGNTETVFDNSWPEYDEEKMKESQIEIAIQLNGRTRGTIMVEAEASKEEVLEVAKEALADRIKGDIIKEIYVPGRIVNIVAK